MNDTPILIEEISEECALMPRVLEEDEQLEDEE
jgi:hypothetical protein